MNIDREGEKENTTKTCNDFGWPFPSEGNLAMFEVNAPLDKLKQTLWSKLEKNKKITDSGGYLRNTEQNQACI